MKIDFDKQLKDLDGKGLTTPVKFKLDPKTGQAILGEDGQPIVSRSEPVKLSVVCINALMANKRDEQISGTEKVSRYLLAARIKQAKTPINIDAEEVVKIKELVGEFMSTLIAGAAYQILEGKEK